MSLSIRVKTIWVLLLSGFSIYLGVANLADRLQWKQAEDGVEWVQTKRGAEVLAVLDGAVAGGEAPRAGDLLISVQNIPVAGVDQLIELRDVLARSLSGIPIEYVFQRGEEGTFSARLTLRYRSQVGGGDFVLAAVAFGYLLIGLFIFLRHWNAAGAFHFYVLCLVAFILMLLSHSGRADSFDLTVYWFNSAALLLLPPLFLHFSLCFPRPTDWLVRVPWRKALLYAPAAGLAALHAAWFSGRLQPFGLARNEAMQTLLDRVYLVHFVVLFLAGGLALLRLLRGGTVSTIQRHQIKWVAYGTLAGLAPFTLVYAVPYLLGWPVDAVEEASVVSLLLIPLSYGYAITRYRLMDVDLIFKKSAAYLLASAALLGVYVLIVILVGQAMQGLWAGSQPLLLALGALLVALTFAPLKDRIQEMIDRSFYKDRYGYRQSFVDFGRMLNTEISLPEIVGKISDRLRMTLDLKAAAVFLREEPGRPFYTLFDPQKESESRIEIGDADLDRLSRESSELFPEAFSDDLAAVRAALREMGLRYFQPLQVHDRLIGFLGLGNRSDGRLLSSEDLQLVSALADYAAIAIDNASLYRSLESNAAQLSELKAYSENVVESIATGVVVVSPDGEITTWNSTMEELYGLPREEALGKNLREIFPEALIGSLQPFLNGPRWDLATTGRLHKTHLKPRSGEARMVHITLAPFVTTNNLNAGTLLAFDDVTDKTRLENQLMQAEKLSSIGLFAAGIAHEVNTPLAGISSYVQMLVKDTPETDPRHSVLRRIEQQTFRASAIINNLLNFARVSESDLAEVNVNGLLAETVSLLSHPMRKHRVEVELDLDATLPTTLGNGGKLQQVFMNLFLNAKDAMPRGGRLRIKTRARNSSLVVEVADTGEGISDENIKKIYDPFFTTKEVGKGTGLGLSVSYGIIQEHSGRISVDSQPGRGTVFTLELPVKRVH